MYLVIDGEIEVRVNLQLCDVKQLEIDLDLDKSEIIQLNEMKHSHNSDE